MQQLGHLGVTGQAGLGGGDEDAQALDLHDDAALVLLGHDALDHGLVLAGGLDVVPALDRIQAALGQHHGALDVVDADHAGLNGIADVDQILDLRAVLILKLLNGNVSGVLGPQVHRHLGRGDRGDDAGDSLSVVDRLDRRLQQLLKALLLFRNGFCFLDHGLGDSFLGNSFGGLSGSFDRFSDFVHLMSYLLQDPPGHAGPGGDTYGIKCL